MALNHDKGLDKKTRAELMHDWEQGSYVEGSTYEDSFDWQELDTLEEHAMELLSDWSEEKRLGLSWSAGIDSLVIAHMLMRLGYTHVPIMNAATPEYYPTHKEYAEVMGERMGFEVVMCNKDHYDIHWVKENQERHLFPSRGVRWWQITQTYHPCVDEYTDAYDIELNLSGVRTEHNTTTSYVRDRPFLQDGQWEGAPLYRWHVRHVLAYCDRYNLPIDPLYRYHPGGTGYPWHGVVSEERNGDLVATEEALWFRTRQTCVEYGYTDFWKRIIEHFPRSEDMAVTYAMEKNKDFLDIEDGYSYGADAMSVVPDWFDPEPDKY